MTGQVTVAPLDVTRAWKVRRFAVASSLGSYLGRSETRRHEDLPLPTVHVRTRRDNPR